jgi:hypothetical protein
MPKFSLKQLFWTLTLVSIGFGIIRHSIVGYSNRWDAYRQGYIDGRYRDRSEYATWLEHHRNKTSPRFDRFIPNNEKIIWGEEGLFEPRYISDYNRNSYDQDNFIDWCNAFLQAMLILGTFFFLVWIFKG